MLDQVNEPDRLFAALANRIHAFADFEVLVYLRPSELCLALLIVRAHEKQPVTILFQVFDHL